MLRHLVIDKDFASHNTQLFFATKYVVLVMCMSMGFLT